MSFKSSIEVIQYWLEAVNARDIERVIALYAEESRLIPTFSPHTLRDEHTLRSYFERLAQRPGLVVTLHERTLGSQDLAAGIEIMTGIYRFQFSIDDEPLVFEARFSFVIDLNRPKPILHHHSSQIPRTLG